MESTSKYKLIVASHLTTPEEKKKTNPVPNPKNKKKTKQPLQFIITIQWNLSNQFYGKNQFMKMEKKLPQNQQLFQLCLLSVCGVITI